MEKKQAILQQFKNKMEAKYGAISTDTTSYVLNCLLNKDKVTVQDFKIAEDQIKSYQKSSNAGNGIDSNEYNERGNSNTRRRLNRKFNSSLTNDYNLINNGSKSNHNTPDIRANKKKMRANCSQSEIKHHNIYSFYGCNKNDNGYPNKMNCTKVLSESGSSVIRSDKASDPFHRSVIVYSDDYLQRHSKNINEEKQRLLSNQQKEKQKLKEFLSKQIDDRSKRMLDSYINEKKIDTELPNALNIDDTKYSFIIIKFFELIVHCLFNKIDVQIKNV